MKSRTSFFNGTLYRKNLTRFAPIWAVYGIVLFLYFSGIAGLSTEYLRCLNGARMANAMSVVNLIYAAVLVTFLFGDLFNSRHCNMLHAFPLRRETIFFTNLASVFTFSLVPNLILALISLPFMGSGWMVSVGWFLAGFLMFLFYMGTALLAVMLTGNRLGFLAVYVLVNFLSLLFLWFAHTIFMPLLFGIRIPYQPFTLFCPTYNFLEMNALVDVNIQNVNTTAEYIHVNTSDSEFIVSLGHGWGYLAICAAIGAALLALALVLYRKRKLETAGDFIAFKVIEPIFLVLFTLGVGAFFQLFSDLFGYGSQYLFLTAGIIVGFFACLMLLQKTTRVFTLRTFRNFCIFAASLAVLLLLTKLDPLGITRKIPETDEILSVTVGESYASSNHIWDGIELTAPEDIETIRNVHRFAVNDEERHVSVDGDNIYYLDIGIDYKLKDGKILSRYYSVPVGSSAADDLRPILSRIECVAQMSAEEFLKLKDTAYMIYTDGENIAVNRNLDITGLLEAVLADCETGAMVQYNDYHFYDHDYVVDYMKNDAYLEIDYVRSDGQEAGVWLNVYDDCVNTLAWMKEHNLIS